MSAANDSTNNSFRAPFTINKSTEGATGQAVEDAELLQEQIVRLTRSVQEGWDRSLRLEVRIKTLKQEARSQAHSHEVLMRTRRDLTDLKVLVLDALSELRSGSDAAKSILTTTLAKMSASSALESHTVTLQSTNISFASTVDTDTSLSDSRTESRYTTDEALTFTMSEEKMSDWYAARTRTT